jgi:CPA1 family monovalent cation:H+ antiporter
MRASYQLRVATADRTLREIYNQRSEQSSENRSDRTKLEAIRRQLLLAEKGALTDALRKRILSEVVVQKRIKQIDELLLKLEDD